MDFRAKSDPRGRPQERENPLCERASEKAADGIRPTTFCMAVRPTSSPERRRIWSFAGISWERCRRPPIGNMHRYAAIRALVRTSARNPRWRFHFWRRHSKSAAPGELVCVDVHPSRVRGRADSEAEGGYSVAVPAPPGLYKPRHDSRGGPVDDPRGARGLHRIACRARRPHLRTGRDRASHRRRVRPGLPVVMPRKVPTRRSASRLSHSKPASPCAPAPRRRLRTSSKARHRRRGYRGGRLRRRWRCRV